MFFPCCCLGSECQTTEQQSETEDGNWYWWSPSSGGNAIGHIFLDLVRDIAVQTTFLIATDHICIILCRVTKKSMHGGPLMSSCLQCKARQVYACSMVLIWYSSDLFQIFTEYYVKPAIHVFSFFFFFSPNISLAGVRKYGKDFQAIADVIGNKTVGQVKNFFVNYRRRFNLEEVLQEWEAEQGTRAPNGDSATSGDDTKNNSNTPSGKSTDEEEEEVLTWHHLSNWNGIGFISMINCTICCIQMNNRKCRSKNIIQLLYMYAYRVEMKISVCAGL